VFWLTRQQQSYGDGLGLFVKPLSTHTIAILKQGRDISPRLLKQIAIDIGLTVEEFLESR
jgi:hypothetical protein